MKFIIIVIILLSSCTMQNDFEKNLIIRQEKGYWNEFQSNGNGDIKYTNNQWCFYENGTAISYVSFNQNKKGTPTTINLESSNTLKWKYNANNKVFTMCATCIYYVERYNRDTILLKFISNSKEYLLIRHH